MGRALRKGPITPQSIGSLIGDFYERLTKKMLPNLRLPKDHLADWETPGKIPVEVKSGYRRWVFQGEQYQGYRENYEDVVYVLWRYWARSTRDENGKCFAMHERFNTKKKLRIFLATHIKYLVIIPQSYIDQFVRSEKCTTVREHYPPSWGYWIDFKFQTIDDMLFHLKTPKEMGVDPWRVETTYNQSIPILDTVATCFDTHVIQPK